MEYKLLYLSGAFFVSALILVITSAVINIVYEPKVVIYKMEKSEYEYYMTPLSGFEKYSQCYEHRLDGRLVFYSEQELRDYVNNLANECGLKYDISFGNIILGSEIDISLYNKMVWTFFISLYMFAFGIISLLLYIFNNLFRLWDRQNRIGVIGFEG